ncbi:MAG: regulatory protein RecX [Gammaproteobacteria bacterium]|nr:regulatory protein RecX [Gammaproteobacteria bacterium]
MGGASPAQIRRLAMNFLARREHGYAELVGKLVGRGVNAEIADNIVKKLSQEGLQDDARFAEGYLRAQVSRGKGPLYIRHGLRQRGIASAEAEQAVKRAHLDWVALATEVACKKFPSGPASMAERASRQRFLLQRGFDPEQCRLALKRLESGAHTE